MSVFLIVKCNTIFCVSEDHLNSQMYELHEVVGGLLLKRYMKCHFTLGDGVGGRGLTEIQIFYTKNI